MLLAYMLFLLQEKIKIIMLTIEAASTKLNIEYIPRVYFLYSIDMCDMNGIRVKIIL